VSKPWRAVVSLALVATAGGITTGVVEGSSAGATSSTIYVAGGASGGSGRSCETARYPTIFAGIEHARAGDTVVVCAGTYKEPVRVTKAITLHGEGVAVVDATSFDVGVLVTASHATVAGLTVTNATGQGIFATKVHGVTIKGNVVEHNDLGIGGKSSYLYCTTANFVPDCGEGIHLSGVAGSRVVDNTIRSNSGGLLVSDELGPTHGNLIQGNTVTDNTANCGITIVGHKAGAVDSSGRLHPKVAGVYDNVVSQNTVTNNGTVGTGGGILLANPRAGMATYKNTIRANTVARNGLAGITLNENTTGQYLDGNVIVGNTVGTNNLLGSQTAGNGSTTGISVYVADGGPQVRVTIRDNAISANVYGIYGGKGTVLTQSGNTFDGVTTSVYVAT
jgi:parallel beta-helix repeat protein